MTIFKGPCPYASDDFLDTNIKRCTVGKKDQECLCFRKGKWFEQRRVNNCNYKIRKERSEKRKNEK